MPDSGIYKADALGDNYLEFSLFLSYAGDDDTIDLYLRDKTDSINFAFFEDYPNMYVPIKVEYMENGSESNCNVIIQSSMQTLIDRFYEYRKNFLDRQKN